jgi:hypothetical protein
MNTNLQFFLNSYADLSPTTAPSQNNFKWLREINGIPFTIENDQQIQILPGITTPNIVPYPFSTPTNSGDDTLNSTTILTINNSPIGIAPDQLIVGGGIPIGTTVVSLISSTVFTVTSANATVGAIYSNNGQQFTVTTTIVAGTTLTTTQTGTPFSSGTLTLVSGTGDATITFSSSVAPTVTMSMAATSSGTAGISFYSPASFVYMESDQQVSVIYNNGTAIVLNPFEINGLTQPAVFFMASPVYSLTVNNLSTLTANIFFASMG